MGGGHGRPLGVFLGASALANIPFFTAQFDGRRWVAFLSLSGPGRFVDWLLGAPFDLAPGAGSGRLHRPRYLVAMSVVAVVAGAIPTWRVLRLRA